MKKPKPKKTKPPQNKPKGEPQKSDSPKRQTPHRLAWGVFVVFATLIGVASSAAAFLPRLTLAPVGSFDPSTPSPTIFRISNAGVVRLVDVQPTLGLCELRFEGAPALTGVCSHDKVSSRLMPSFLHRDALDVDGFFDISVQEILNPGPRPYAYADISIGVSFYPWFFPFWKQEREFRFVTKKGGDGKLYWQAK